MLGGVVKFIGAMQGNARPSHVALGLSLGLCLAFMPPGNLLWPFVFIIFLFIKLNMPSMLIMALVGKLFTALFASQVEGLGYYLLTMEGLQGLWKSLYSLPLFPLTRFNNSLVLGGFVVGVASIIVSYPLFLGFVSVYKKHIGPKLGDNPLIKKIKSLPIIKNIVGLFEKASNVYNGLG